MLLQVCRASHNPQDIDIVVDIEKFLFKKFVEVLSPQIYYLDRKSVITAINRKSMFNLLDVNSEHKKDFWILTRCPFDESRFMHRISEKFIGIEIRVSTPEDTILAKLRCAKLSGGSEGQFNDALNIWKCG